MWGDLIAEIVKAVIPALVQTGAGVGGQLLSQKLNPQRTAPQGQGFGSLPSMAPNPATAGVMGSGTATRPASLNFTGGFTGTPPSTPSGPQGGPGPGGFNLLDRPSPRPSPPGGI